MSIIKSIEIIPINIPLTEPFVISRGAKTHAKNTVIIIRTNNGLFGTGECCPYRSIHGETQEGSVAIAKVIAKNLIAKNSLEIVEHVCMMDRLITGNASIKCAFDMALYDLAAKHAELPLYAFLLGNASKTIYTDMTVSLLSPEEMAEKALKYKSQGFPFLKIKLGKHDGLSDVKRIHSIREAIGDEIPLRIDANQGWNYHSAMLALDGIKECGIEHCEEPIPAWNMQDQTRLNSVSPIPIMADESVFNHHDAIQVLSANAADMINIKLGKSGGICNATKIAAIAEAADVWCQVGSFSESRLGITALTHFAMVWECIRFFDLDSPLMLSEDPVIGGMEYHSDWQVTVSDEPGIGAHFDEDFLKLCKIIKVT